MSLVAGTQNLILDGPLLLAIPVAMSAGALSFFSPCCLPLVPGYLSYVTGSLSIDAVDPRRRLASAVSKGSPTAVTVSAPRGGKPATPPRLSRTVTGSGLFVLGFAAVFTGYGAAFGGLGALLIQYQRLLAVVLGSATVLLGLMFAGVLQRVPWAARTWRPGYRPRAGLIGAPLLGVMFGLGWTPCIGPTLAAVLSLATTSSAAWRGAALAFAYSMGLGVPFLVAAITTARASTYFAWPRRHAPTLLRGGGAFLVIMGALQVSGLWADLMARLQGWIGGWQPQF